MKTKNFALAGLAALTTYAGGCSALTKETRHNISQASRDAKTAAIRAFGGRSTPNNTIDFYTGNATERDYNSPFQIANIGDEPYVFVDLRQFDVKIHNEIVTEGIFPVGVFALKTAYRDLNLETGTFEINYDDVFTGDKGVWVFQKDPSIKVRSTGRTSKIELLANDKLEGWKNVPEFDLPHFYIKAVNEEFDSPRETMIVYGEFDGDNNPATKEPIEFFPSPIIRWNPREGTYDENSHTLTAMQQIIPNDKLGAYVQKWGKITPKPTPAPEEDLVIPYSRNAQPRPAPLLEEDFPIELEPIPSPVRERNDRGLLRLFPTGPDSNIPK